ncbi:MAG: hypothetical protein JHC88_04730 [Niveispirillum sp.]|nr:hypothetical protein [Niveispirillum sp.]
MSSLIPVEASENSDALACLQMRYDGRLPRRARLVALVGGDDVLCSWAEQARGDRLLAQCAGARLALARRRRQLPAARIGDDPWLRRLTGALRTARDGAVAALGEMR